MPTTSGNLPPSFFGLGQNPQTSGTNYGTVNNVRPDGVGNTKNFPFFQSPDSGGQPGPLDDILFRGLRGAGRAQGNPALNDVNQLSRSTGAQALYDVLGFGGSGGGGGLPLGFASIIRNLFNQGQIDPRFMNQQLQGIDRGTQGQQLGLQANLAQQGLQGSGVGQALGAAIGQGGENRRAAAIAADQQAAADRHRGDINQALDAFLRPALDAFAIERGVSGQSAARDQQQSAANQQFYAALLSAFL